MKVAAAATIVFRHGRIYSGSSSSSIWQIDKDDDTLPYQRKIRQFYLLPRVQILVATLILLNFFTAAAQAQMLPEKDSFNSQWFVNFEYFYVWAFVIELVVNLYGHWWSSFWRNGWNWFDFIIVSVSLMSMYFPDLPAISVLRLFRAFRVVRLFKRVKKMRKIIEGIMRSLLALYYTFLCMALIMGIWGIIGVSLFADLVSMDTQGNLNKGYYFGNFFKSILSLGQITTFDSWSSGIVRDIVIIKGPVAAIYFASYIFVGSILMMNVLVALLLDNYITPNDGDNEDSTIEKYYRFTPEIVFRWLVSCITRTDIDLRTFSRCLDISLY
jgi:voltage-gated sodium channel